MSETNKHRNIFIDYCQGNGLDIGFGGDPIVDTAICFDLPKGQRYSFEGLYKQHIEGDARSLYMFADNGLDYVYSSHVLEDFEDIYPVLVEWLRVIKIDGYLCLLFPNEREYKKKTKVYNQAHKNPDFSLEYVLHILGNISKVQSFCKNYDLEVIHAEDHFENNDYNCSLIARKMVVYL
jgi:ubiquinone/menaquinone biosynthesis C-methylase UbiE